MINIIFCLIVLTVALICIQFLIKWTAKTVKRLQNNRKYTSLAMREVDKLSGEDFEAFLAAHLCKLGGKVTVTPKSKDYGADLLVKMDKEMWAIQAKRYKSKVGIKAVQEIISAREYYHADRAMVCTNSFFTGEAVKLAKECKVVLWDRGELVKRFSVKDVTSFKANKM